MMDPSNLRRSLGPSLDVCIRLSTPLLKPEKIVKHERWFQLDFFHPIQESVPTKEPITKQPDAVPIASKEHESMESQLESKSADPTLLKTVEPSLEGLDVSEMDSNKTKDEELEEMILNFKRFLQIDILIKI